MSNSEWIKGPPPSVSERGEVESLSSYETGSVPIEGWVFDQDRESYLITMGSLMQTALFTTTANTIFTGAEISSALAQQKSSLKTATKNCSNRQG